MLVLAVEDDELEAARGYAEAVGGEEVDLRADPWFADDLAGGFVVDGGWTLDAMGATMALAESARREARISGSAVRRSESSSRAGASPDSPRTRECFPARGRPRDRPVAATPSAAAGSRAPRDGLARLAPRDRPRRTIPALRDRAGALADAGRDGERRRRTDGARGRGRRRRRAGRRLAAARRATGWSLPHRHVAPPVAAGRPGRAGDRSPAGRARRPRLACARGRSCDCRLVWAPSPHSRRIARRRARCQGWRASSWRAVSPPSGW